MCRRGAGSDGPTNENVVSLGGLRRVQGAWAVQVKLESGHASSPRVCYRDIAPYACSGVRNGSISRGGSDPGGGPWPVCPCDVFGASIGRHRRRGSAFREPAKVGSLATAIHRCLWDRFSKSSLHERLRSRLLHRDRAGPQSPAILRPGQFQLWLRCPSRNLPLRTGARVLAGCRLRQVGTRLARDLQRELPFSGVLRESPDRERSRRRISIRARAQAHRANHERSRTWVERLQLLDVRDGALTR